MALRPYRCWIRLLTLHFRQLIERMFFAGCGKQDNPKRNNDDGQANKRSHSAVPQLSVSRPACKAKAQWSGATAGRAGLFTITSTSQRQRKSCIETRGRRTTITRGGPHRKSQRLERSVRPRSAFYRHPALFCADFLHAEGYTLLALVQPCFAGKSSRTKFYRAAWGNRGRHLLPVDRRFRIAVAGSGSARIWRGEIILPAIPRGSADPMDCFVPHFWCLPR